MKKCEHGWCLTDDEASIILRRELDRALGVQSDKKPQQNHEQASASDAGASVQYRCEYGGQCIHTQLGIVHEHAKPEPKFRREYLGTWVRYPDVYSITDEKARGLSTLCVNGVLYDLREASRSESNADVVIELDVSPETTPSLTGIVERIAALKPTRVVVDASGLGKTTFTYLKDRLGPIVQAKAKGAS